MTLAGSRCLRYWRELPVLIEAKRIKQVTQSGAIQGNIRIKRTGFWIGKVVATACRQRLQSPVFLDEFGDGDMIVVCVIDLSALRPG